jgi:adenine deaminase
MGEIKADFIITGGRVINVYSGEILDGMEIAVLDGRICYVGPSARHTKGIATEIRDASGSFVSPGFIDGHTHIGYYARPFETSSRCCRTEPRQSWLRATSCRPYSGFAV